MDQDQHIKIPPLMKKHFDTIRDSVTLSSEEKARIFSVIEDTMKDRPLGAVLSPYSRYISLSRHIGASALALCLLLGGSLSYAAAGSLPGDLLYPVKININEKISSTLARSDEAKAKAEEIEALKKSLHESQAEANNLRRATPDAKPGKPGK